MREVLLAHFEIILLEMDYITHIHTKSPGQSQSETCVLNEEIYNLNSEAPHLILKDESKASQLRYSECHSKLLIKIIVKIWLK